MYLHMWKTSLFRDGACKPSCNTIYNSWQHNVLPGRVKKMYKGKKVLIWSMNVNQRESKESPEYDRLERQAAVQINSIKINHPWKIYISPVVTDRIATQQYGALCCQRKTQAASRGCKQCVSGTFAQTLCNRFDM